MKSPEQKQPETLEQALPRLYEILFHQDTLRQLFDDDQASEDEFYVDLEAARVAVNKEKAEAVRDEIKHILGLYPGTIYPQVASLEDGPSYIDVGAVLDSQQAAFSLFALGEALGFWTIITPKRLLGDAISSEESGHMMGMGMIMIDGYRPEPTL